ncbi:MAG: nucleotidyltransferase family protein [Pseudobdellovibrio sp.]
MKRIWTLPDTIKKTIDIIAQTARPAKIILFGSRARGTYRDNSDIDLCVVGKTCTEETWAKLLLSIQNDFHTLMKIDLVEYELLTADYHNEIKKDGIIVYESHTQF